MVLNQIPVKVNEIRKHIECVTCLDVLFKNYL